MEQSWKKSTIYQIYPKSFYDSDGDGIGDLQGIIDKLSYLENLGVDYLWLTPIYTSPQHDNGYDIADYYSIDSRYGNMRDFERLLEKAHARGLKIMMDIVVNHTSTEHKWFKEALKSKDNPYRDYYIWKKGKGQKPPTNWISKFGGSAWEWDETTEEYYLHLFDKTQADLNWENPQMRQEIYDMMSWWLAKGVDGFRLDVVNLLSKDQRFQDDTLETAQADGRKYYTDGPKIHQYLQEMNREVFAKFPGTITVGEMSSTTLEHSIQYTKPENKELDMIFNFHHLKVDYPEGEKWALAPVDFAKLKALFNTWQTGMQAENGWNALFLSNHDQPRAISRFVNPTNYHYQGATMLAVMLHGMQGTPYIYQGEEIGMLNPAFSTIEEYRDIESLNYYTILQQRGHSQEETLEILRVKSRDNARTPMQWNTERNAGFSQGVPWIKSGKTAKAINVAVDLDMESSIYHFYQKLIALRKTESLLVTGRYQYIETQDEVYMYQRIASDTKHYILIINNLSDQQTNIETDFHFNAKKYEILLSNYQRRDLSMTLQPYETIILNVVV